MPTPGQRPSSSSRDLTLVVESESGTPEEFFAQVGLSIGRATSNTIYIDHPDVDHIHAKVVKRDESFWLRCEGQAKLQVLDPEPGEVEVVELIPGLTIELGGVIIRCRQQIKGMGSLSDDYWADAAGGERFRVETESFTGDLPKKIGPYEIRKFVARGGMGIVLRGIHQDTDQPAAVKLPTPDLNKDLQWLKRFELEVRTLKSVTHPNLVRLQDAGMEGELHWMAMDWVEGWTVGERLAAYKEVGEPMPLSEIQLVLRQVVEGLMTLHSKGVVHRDLKPGNLLVGQDGSVKVADFGLAKPVGGEQSTFLTRTGTFAGTMHYMAPEQAEGGDITPATDVYALGVIWYELLTSRRPASGRLKLGKFRADCPDNWGKTLEDCLDVEAFDRPSLSAIKQALESGVFKAVAPPTELEKEEERVEETLEQESVIETKTDELPIENRATIGEIYARSFQTDPEKPEEKPLPKAEESRPDTHLQPVQPASPEAFENTLGMKFVPVLGTKVHFCIWETRVRDYAAYVAADTGEAIAPKSLWSRLASIFTPNWESPGFTQEDTHPVVNVSWNDAQAFCAWLTKKEQSEGKIRAGQRYRLSTDAEWSVAVGLGRERGSTPEEKDEGIKDVYPWGKAWPPPEGAGNYSQNLKVDSYEYTSPVGSFAANQHGLHDLGGNVWEWCEDWYDPAAQGHRVLRGASWISLSPYYLLSSDRASDSPDIRYYFYGFRCVLAKGSGR